MGAENIREILQFSDDWFDFGIINNEGLRKHEQEYNKGEDPHPEHYRFRAFMDFLKANPILAQSTIKALYTLGDNDPDEAMGGSMMVTLLRLPECPRDLLLTALQSNRAYVQRVAKAKLDEQP